MTDIDILIEELFSKKLTNSNTKITIKNNYGTPTIQNTYKRFTNEKKVANSSLSWYLNSINKVQMQIDKTREQELLQKIITGGKAAEIAKKHLFYLYLDLVVVIASKLESKANRKINIDDLIQEGNIGLLKAINTYNKSNNDFTNFAITNIKQVICQKYKIRNF